MKYNLIIDATSFQRKKTGIETYGYEVSEALYEKFRHAPGKTLFLFHKQTPSWFYETDSVQACIYGGESKLFMEQFWIPAMVIKYRPAKLFFPVFPPAALMYFIKKTAGIKVYRTIFDVIMWKFPSTTSLKNKLYMRPLETLGTHYYDMVFTISESSKHDILNLFPRLSGKVVNALIGVKPFQETSDSYVDIAGKYQVAPNRYLLFVGTIEPRKNVPFILSVLQEIHRTDPDMKLVLAGRIGWGHAVLMNDPLYKALQKEIVLTDYIDEKTLHNLYRDALAFVFPSLYEGFGLPLVEAMQYGTPVIASDNSSIPEAVQNAGILITGYDAKEWSQKILKLQQDTVLRKQLIDRGYERVSQLSWDNTASIIEKALNA